MKSAHADRMTGILGILLSASYVAYARGIEDSLLADEVGAAGVPTAVGAVLMLASATLLIKGSLAARQAARGNEESSKEGSADSEEPHLPWRAEKLALALLAVLTVYMLVLPLAGYTVSIALLIAAVAWLVGARAPRTVALSALGGALGLYGLFTVLLQIRMPPGMWPAWMGT